MCGRLNVMDEPLIKWLYNYFGVSFSMPSNDDLRPTQSVATLVQHNGVLQQMDAVWGTKPGWAKKIIINARGETVSSKRTFSAAFANQRCLVPCSGWYEWRDEGRARKQKYAFTHVDGKPFLMAGVYLVGAEAPELVTLTTSPNDVCAEVHNRMPVLINPEDSHAWFNTTTTESLQPMISPVQSAYIRVEKC